MGKQKHQEPAAGGLPYTTVHLPRAMKRKLDMIASHRGKGVGEQLVEYIGEQIDRDYRSLADEIHAETGNPVG